MRSSAEQFQWPYFRGATLVVVVVVWINVGLSLQTFSISLLTDYLHKHKVETELFIVTPCNAEINVILFCCHGNSTLLYYKFHH